MPRKRKASKAYPASPATAAIEDSAMRSKRKASKSYPASPATAAIEDSAVRSKRKASKAYPASPAAAAIAVGLCLLVMIAGMRAIPASRPPSPTPRPSPTPSPVQKTQPLFPALPCATDPANLPYVSGPDGRPLSYLHTCGAQIVDTSGAPVHLAGVAWSGMELAGGAPQGLDRQNHQAILLQVKQLGYNTIRIPFSSESIQPNHKPSGINPKLNPDLAGLTSLEVLDRIVADCRALGLKVLLDHHRISPWVIPTLWHDASYSEADWISDWVRLAQRYKNDDTVIAVDLQNEPYKATWGTGAPQNDWRRAAIAAGDAVLKVNPRLLVFVQGIAKEGTDADYWWGGELRGVERAPIELVVPARLVYSPHEYGPAVYLESWFSAPDYPSNLPGVWDEHWGFIAKRGLAPVVVGETGDPKTGYELGGIWQRAFLSYLAGGQIGFISWALNPGTSDTGSVFGQDWWTVNDARQSLYAPYLYWSTSIPTR